MSEYKFGTWYPIDSAPRDGTPVVLFWPFVTQDGIVHSGYFYKPASDVAAFWYSDLVNLGATPPTHWMPLPPPPSNGERKPEDTCSDDRLKEQAPDWMNHAESIGSAMKGDE